MKDKKYHIPKNQQPMNEIYVALSEDDGGEGIVSIMTPWGGMPFVFGHINIMNQAKHYLKDISKETKKKITIYQFKKVDVVEVFE